MRYRRSGGDDQALHQQMMERALIAADIMPAATHLTASMLSSAHPGTTFGRTRVHTLPYGQQSQEKRHTMALGALDLIEDDAAPSLFGTGATVAHGTGVDVESEGSQDMILPRETGRSGDYESAVYAANGSGKFQGWHSCAVICWDGHKQR